MEEEDFEALVADELEALHDVEGNRAGSRYASTSGRRRLEFDDSSNDTQKTADTQQNASSTPAGAPELSTQPAPQPVVAARRYISASGGFPLTSQSQRSDGVAASGERPAAESYEVPLPWQQKGSVDNSTGSGGASQSYEVPFPGRSQSAGLSQADGVQRSGLAAAAGVSASGTKRRHDSASAHTATAAAAAPVVPPADDEGGLDELDDLLDLEDLMRASDDDDEFTIAAAAAAATAEPPSKRAFPRQQPFARPTAVKPTPPPKPQVMAKPQQAPRGGGGGGDDFDDLLDLEDELAGESTTQQKPRSQAAAAAADIDELLGLEDEIDARARAGQSQKGASQSRQQQQQQQQKPWQRQLSQPSRTGAGGGGGGGGRSGRTMMMSGDDAQRARLDDMLGMQSRVEAEQSGFSQFSSGGGVRGQHGGRLEGAQASLRRDTSTAHVSTVTRDSRTEEPRDADGWSPAATLDDDADTVGNTSFRRDDSDVGGGDVLSRAAALVRARRYVDMRRLQGKVFRRPPLTSESLSVISTDGSDYVYVTTRTVEEERERLEKAQRSWSDVTRKAQLLSAPIHELLSEIREKQHQETVDAFNATLDALKESTTSPTGDRSFPDDADLGLDGDLSMDDDDDDGVRIRDQPKAKPSAAPAGPGNRLWVDKYAPHVFTDLLSDDGTNRLLLSWLKLWDGVVFGRKVAAPPPPPPQKPNKEPGKGLTPGLEGYDDTGRPKQKIALLSGPPGLGKTTLAHVIAQHSGYRVLEINASDDRSPDILRQRIETATQNHSVIGGDQRPTCLVIDEIDGAQAAAINVLLTACGAAKPGKKKPSSAGAGAAPAGLGLKKRRAAVQGLSRPVICICNDQYVPALRPLRQQALTVVFYPTQANKLANRLLRISRAEHLQADMTTLLALCEKAEKDIRSCLNTLQFLQRQKKPITLFSVRSAGVGQKDAHKSLFELWHAVFQLPKSKRQRVQANADGTRASSADKQASTNAQSVSNRFRNVLSAAESTGEYDRVRQGLFENYLEMRYKDPSLELVTSSLGWLSEIDILDHRMKKTQDYSFMRYLPFLPVVYHLLFATPNYPKLKYPHASSDNLQKLTQSQQVFSSLLSETLPQIRQHFSLRQAVLDILPPLLEIVAPLLRPVNTQLYNSKERQQLLALISNMISYNVTYRQERQQDGQYQFVMDPNAEVLVRYPGLPQKKQISYSGKQLIAREIELEKMRRLEQGITGTVPGADTNGKPADEPATRAVSPRPGSATAPTPAAPAKSAAQVAKDARKKEIEAKKKLLKNKPVKVALDFFGRPIPAKTTSSGSGGNSADGGSTLWFKFHEGFSNAVRKPIKIQDLL